MSKGTEIQRVETEVQQVEVRCRSRRPIEDYVAEADCSDLWIRLVVYAATMVEEQTAQDQAQAVCRRRELKRSGLSR